MLIYRNLSEVLIASASRRTLYSEEPSWPPRPARKIYCSISYIAAVPGAQKGGASKRQLNQLLVEKALGDFSHFSCKLTKDP